MVGVVDRFLQLGQRCGQVWFDQLGQRVGGTVMM
jgi:hypothetical protein